VRLAWKTSAYEVNWLEFIPSQLSYVAISFHLRPMFLQYLLAERIELHLPDYLHARSFKPQF